MIRFAAVLLGSLLFVGRPALAQVYGSTCADCHIVTPGAPAPEHIVEWSRSVHERHGVGCEKCHGGNATTRDPARAHEGVLRSADRLSRVNFRNLPATCGACHPSPSAAFERSRHNALLAQGDPRVPVCSACHTAVGGRLPSPAQLGDRCRTCHGGNNGKADANRAAAMQTLYESLHQARDLLRHAEPLLADINPRTERERLMGIAQEAATLLRQATDAGHEFDGERLTARLSAARARVDAVLAGIEASKRR
jgi:hypothetical protein